MAKIVVAGAKGRMAQSILRCAAEDREIEIVGTAERGDFLKNILKPGVVIIDFTAHNATPAFAKAAEEIGCPMVIGTTGFTYDERKLIRDASTAIPIVLAPNMSVGVNLLFALTKIVGAVLREGFDIEIIEKHHRNKKDSPSGTAARLAALAAEGRGLAVSKVSKHGRFGDLGERTSQEIGVHSIRGGDYVGEHTVIYAGDGEIVEITHKASSRDIFSKGALLAAKWVAAAKPGLYDMEDVLGLQVSRQSE